MSFDLKHAVEFVESIDLTDAPKGLLPKAVATTPSEIFDKAKTQAQVVGAGVYSFATGITVETREAISDSALLAQLYANQNDPDQQNPLEWLSAYTRVLEKIGWTLQESGLTDYTAKGVAADVHQKILEVMSMALGPTPAALAIINGTLNALKGMKSDSPWITIFSRESRKAQLARFQIGLVEKEEASDVFVSMLACLIEAHTDITQILFFKWKEDRAAFKANTAKVSINRPSLAQLGPIIRAKVLQYQLDYLRTFEVHPEPVKIAKTAQEAA